MTSAFADNTLLGGLFGDADIAAWLTPAAELRAMIQFERALARAEAATGVIPAAAGPAISDALAGHAPDADELIAPTRSAGVAVPGLVRMLREAVGAPHGGYVHWGATSQDVTDTGLILRLREILPILKSRLARLTDTLAECAREHASLPMAARTRSQIATPTTFGLRIAGWRAPLARCRARLREFTPRLLVVQFGGASGNLSVLGENAIAAMEALARELDLGCPEKPWHAERDTIVELANWLAMVSGLLGRIGGDLILAGRSEAAEATAGAGGGSSTMPQKSNPVLAESLVTLARFNAGLATQMQGALMHHEERDGPAWAGEWLVLPQMLIATGAGLTNALELAQSLAPHPANMQRIMESGGGAVHAEALAFALAAHIPLGEAQAIVKDAARAPGGTLAERVNAICAERGLPAVKADPADVAGPAAVLIGRSLAGNDKAG